MAKNILAILGTARKQNTYTLLGQFTKGARAAGHVVESIQLDTQHIFGCSGCDACRRNNSLCVQIDAMTAIYPKFEVADVIVLACPVYYGSITAQAKAFIDRLYCYGAPMGKESALLLTSGGGSGENVDSAVSTYHIARKYLSWADLGVVLADGVATPLDVRNHDAYDTVYDLAKSIN